MLKATTTVNIVPGRMTSRATVLRACISEALADARLDDEESLEKAIERMRIALTLFERELRLNVMKED